MVAPQKTAESGRLLNSLFSVSFTFSYFPVYFFFFEFEKFTSHKTRRFRYVSYKEIMKRFHWWLLFGVLFSPSSPPPGRSVFVMRSAVCCTHWMT